MLKVLFGSSTGILSIVTVVGALLVVIGWAVYWYIKIGRETSQKSSPDAQT